MIENKAVQQFHATFYFDFNDLIIIRLLSVFTSNPKQRHKAQVPDVKFTALPKLNVCKWPKERIWR
jgi:hypothetical protein